MKKFLFLLVTTLAAIAVNAQMVYTSEGKLTFGNVSVPDGGFVTAWEGGGHYFHNGSANGGDTWIKLDLTDKTPRIYSNNGEVYFYGIAPQNIYSGKHYVYCDRRDMTGIAPLENGLSLVNMMRPKTYAPARAYVEIKKRAHYGFLADELNAVVPAAVTEDRQGRAYIDYEVLVPILTKAVQELTHLVAQQELRIRELEGVKTKP